MCSYIFFEFKENHIHMIFMNGHYLGYFKSLRICNKLTNKSKAKNKWMWKTKTGVWVTTT